MRRKYAITAFALLISISTESIAEDAPISPFDNSIFDREKQGWTDVEIAPDWIVSCSNQKIDELGNIAVAAHCGVGKLALLDIIVVDARRGVRLHFLPNTQICDHGQVEIAVDRSKIQNLPTPKQLDALKHGKTYARSTERAWPDCWLGIETTSLTGFDTALRTMMLLWNSRDKKLGKFKKPTEGVY